MGFRKRTEDGKRYAIWPGFEGGNRHTIRDLNNFAIMQEVIMK